MTKPTTARLRQLLRAAEDRAGPTGPTHPLWTLIIVAKRFLRNMTAQAKAVGSTPEETCAALIFALTQALRHPQPTTKPSPAPVHREFVELTPKERGYLVGALMIQHNTSVHVDIDRAVYGHTIADLHSLDCTEIKQLALKLDPHQHVHSSPD